MSKKLLALSLALVMLLGILTACGGNNSPAADGGQSTGTSDTGDKKDEGNKSEDSAPAKDVLIVAHQNDCGDMNPHGLTSFDYWKVKSQCYEPLFTLDFETNEILPVLATGYEWIDNKTLKITLKEGVQFHNGYGEMTAEDVMFTLETVYASAANYPIAELDLDACEIVNDYEIILRTKNPYSPLVNNLTNCATSIFSKKGYEEDNGAFSKDIGTGPFVITEWLEGESVTQTRFEEYHEGPVALRQIIWKVIDSETSRGIELQTDACDLAYGVSMLDKTNLEASDKVFETIWTNDVNTVVFNCELDIFQDKNIRRGFAHTIDPVVFATTGTNDPSRATKMVLDYHHPYSWENEEAAMAAGANIAVYDLDKAKECFEAAGYYDPSSPIYNHVFKLEISPDTSWAGWAPAWKSTLDSIGVQLEIESYDWATYVNDIKVSRDFEICAWGTAPVTGDFDYMALHYYSESTASINIPQCKDPEFDALVLEYRATTDDAEKKEIAQKAQLILYDQCYQVPAYETVETLSYSSALKGFKMGMFQSPLLKSCYFE